jgi:hypothetical protein
MALRWQGFAVPKRGNSAEEYEDAFAGNPKAGRFAVADGASESSFASLWAKLLVDGFTQPPPGRTARKHWLGPLRQRWAAEVGKLELPWYAEAKRALGAEATFLGLVLRRSAKAEGGLWLAVAVGDSCLFHLRGDQLVKAFPLTRAEEFGNQPQLLNSRPVAGNARQPDPKQARGQWRVGDRLLLMTDALAQWFLRCHEEGRPPWRSIEQVLADPAPDKAFPAWIDALRDQGGLRNDDVTLLVIAP